ncbi:aminotransferase class IV family protein [Nocardia mexicana]|uniref:Branched-subunit amino acid aminotransferase/4-amino-4-deoxychorismate lyase n=1 Tax=Nocardia mexicana TaxID=279262 RepID=A0A370GJX3_9NOCA|nr:aminotransferase class IV family protein [Nocardia mexicana]RDI43559.1 branched-subunit amino acid aminotransferase/4-amino-4-deoxychorismate lyase [Nocardia mexicana]
MELNGAPVTPDDLAPLGLVGYGHFTSMRVEDGATRGFSLHLDRLVRDCREVFATDLDPDRVRDHIRHAVRDVTGPVTVRVTVYDPDIQLGRPGADAAPRILVTMRAAPPAPQGPVALQAMAYARDLPRVKHVGLFGALYHRANAQRSGFDDAVFTDPGGVISEITTSNIGFITTEGQLVWPRAYMLVGTTMRLLARARDENVVTETVTLDRLGEFVGAVATNAAVGVRAVSRIDDTHWATDHDLIEVLRKDYESIPPEQI